MSAAEDHQEIIIVKRVHDDHDEHHGGAWKIAFADFMTAMMALFLVLWLVNAANEETRQAVASYFNPVKLVDRNRSVKGLYDARGMQEIEVQTANDMAASGGQGEQNAQAASGTGDESAASGDAAFFSDPFDVLDQIASSHQAGDDPSARLQPGFRAWSAEDNQASEQTFLDPFAPERWADPTREAPQESGQLVDAVTGIEASDTDTMREDADAAPASDAGQVQQAGMPEVDPLLAAIPPESEATPPVGQSAPASDVQQDIQDGSGQTASSQDAANPDASDATSDMEAGQADTAQTAAANEALDPSDEADQTMDPAQALQAQAEALRDEITAALEDAFGDGAVVVEQLSVQAQDEAILISLTDNLQIPMFEIGSAVPSPPLVIALERVGGVIGDRVGGVRIEGHTDARPFAAGTSDNWQLSSARAQAAFYMLVRGGVPEDRIKQVSGRADRDLAVPEDPFSARNRRIDILLDASRP